MDVEATYNLNSMQLTINLCVECRVLLTNFAFLRGKTEGHLNFCHHGGSPMECLQLSCHLDFYSPPCGAGRHDHGAMVQVCIRSSNWFCRCNEKFVPLQSPNFMFLTAIKHFMLTTSWYTLYNQDGSAASSLTMAFHWWCWYGLEFRTYRMEVSQKEFHDVFSALIHGLLVHMKIGQSSRYWAFIKYFETFSFFMWKSFLINYFYNAHKWAGYDKCFAPLHYRCLHSGYDDCCSLLFWS